MGYEYTLKSFLNKDDLDWPSESPYRRSGKGWAVGFQYHHKPSTLHNMGTENGRIPFDIRVFLANLDSVLAVHGPLTWDDFRS